MFRTHFSGHNNSGSTKKIWGDTAPECPPSLRAWPQERVSWYGLRGKASVLIVWCCPCRQFIFQLRHCLDVCCFYLQSLRNSAYDRLYAIYHLLVDRLKMHRTSFPLEARFCFDAGRRRPSNIADQALTKVILWFKFEFFHTLVFIDRFISVCRFDTHPRTVVNCVAVRPEHCSQKRRTSDLPLLKCVYWLVYSSGNSLL